MFVMVDDKSDKAEQMGKIFTEAVTLLSEKDSDTLRPVSFVRLDFSDATER